MGGDSRIDDRTLRELYLLPFEIAVEQGHPASVMCSYKRLNGDYACENSVLLTDILKTQWHFTGQVQSDWGATHMTAKAINAGLDEEEGSDAGPSYFGRVPVIFALANHDITSALVLARDTVLARTSFPKESYRCSCSCVGSFTKCQVRTGISSGLSRRAETRMGNTFKR
jgi:hypothetical protein